MELEGFKGPTVSNILGSMLEDAGFTQTKVHCMRAHALCCHFEPATVKPN